MKTRRRIFRWKRRLHISIGVIFALYFLLMAFTGVMINHTQDWGFTDRYVSRRYLPSDYRPQDGDATRLDIVITDLHSGMIFGRYGHWLPDLVTAFWTISILSGVGMLFFRKTLNWGKPAAQPASTVMEISHPLADRQENHQPVAADVERR